MVVVANSTKLDFDRVLALNGKRKETQAGARLLGFLFLCVYIIDGCSGTFFLSFALFSFHDCLPSDLLEGGLTQYAEVRSEIC